MYEKLETFLTYMDEKLETFLITYINVRKVGVHFLITYINVRKVGDIF